MADRFAVRQLGEIHAGLRTGRNTGSDPNQADCPVLETLHSELKLSHSNPPLLPESRWFSVVSYSCRVPESSDSADNRNGKKKATSKREYFYVLGSRQVIESVFISKSFKLTREYTSMNIDRFLADGVFC